MFWVELSKSWVSQHGDSGYQIAREEGSPYFYHHSLPDPTLPTYTGSTWQKPAMVPSKENNCDVCQPAIGQGKFIRIHFGAKGKLASADIETCESQHPVGHSGIWPQRHTTQEPETTFFLITLRSLRKIQSDISVIQREKLPHFLPNLVEQEARTHW